MKRWWWLGVVIGCHHDDKIAVGHPDDNLLPCPAHSWKTPPAPSKVAFGDACRGLDQPACTARCEAGGAGACTEAGTALGRTVRFDSPEWSPKKPNLACAADLFELTCAAGEPNGCGELGFAYADGAGRPRDLAKAVAAFKRGCIDARLEDPITAQSAGMVCGLFLDNVDDGKLGTVDPAVVQAAEARTCELGHCRHGK